MREPQGSAGAWDLGFVLVCAGAFLVVNALGAGLATGFAPDAPAYLRLAGTVPGFAFLWFFARALVGRYDPRGEAALGLVGSPLRGLLEGCKGYLRIALLLWPAVLVYSLGLEVFGVELPRQPALDAIFDPAAPRLVFALMLVQAIVLAPLAEETLFRALLLGWLRKRLSFGAAAVVTGVAFGLVHDLTHALPLAVFGYLLCTLREREGGLWACIGAHGLHNTVVLSMPLTGWV